jgi:hypothetical protein
VLELLEDDDGGAFTHDESVAVSIEWSAGVSWVVVLTREGTHRREAGHGEWSNTRFASTAEHDLGAAESDRVVSASDCHGGGCAGGAGRGDGTAEAEIDRHPARGHIWHEGGHKAGMDTLPRAAARGEARHASLGGPDRRADPVRLLSHLETGIRLGHTGRRNGELREAVRSALCPLVEPS